jgi:NRAMP (natural resistance-associated macrophage protein)-like metal ion transporter
MRGLLAVLRPGLITGASDDDPSGIATYSQAGAQFGYGMAWVMLFTWPLMAAIQEVSARIGRVTGEGIAGNIHEHYPHWLLLTIVALLLVANTINFVHLDPIKALFWAAVINGVVAVPLMVVIMIMTRQKRVMGPFTIPLPLAAMGWLSTGAMAAAVAGMFATW